MSDLPVDIDITFPDRDAGDAQHQRHHDSLHALYNELKGSETAAGLATLQAILDGTYAPLASPALTGTPTAPTPTEGDSSTKVATTAFVGTAVDNATSDQLAVGPGEFIAALGSPSTGALNGATPAWHFDAATRERILAVVPTAIPGDWSTFDIDVIWSGLGGAAGNVVWAVEIARLGATDGDRTWGWAVTDKNDGTVTAPFAGYAGAQYLTIRDTVLSGVNAAKYRETGDIINLAVDRMAADAADTLAGDAALIAVLFRKAS